MKNVCEMEALALFCNFCRYAGHWIENKVTCYYGFIISYRYLQFLPSISPYQVNFYKTPHAGQNSARSNCLFNTQNVIRLTNPGSISIEFGDSKA